MSTNDPSQSSTRTHTADTRNPEWETYAPKGEGRTDEQIRADVHQALLEMQDTSGKNIALEVKDGVVTLSGRVASDDQRKQLDKLVRGVDSVRDFRDQLEVGS